MIIPSSYKTRHIAFALFLMMCGNLTSQPVQTNELPPPPLPRRALVIGMESYEAAGRIRQAKNDAHAVADALDKVGFIVFPVIENATLARLQSEISNFIDSVSPGDVVVVYYAGHGTQIAEQNYLIPVDYHRRLGVDPRDLYPIAELIRDLQAKHTALNIVILDACRSSAVLTGTSTGLAKMDQIPDTFAALATLPGQTVTDDDANEYGLFTSEIVKVLSVPGLTLDEFFNQVRTNVVQRKSAQRPSVSTNATMSFIFHDEAQNEYQARRLEAQLQEKDRKLKEVTERARNLKNKEEKQAEQDERDRQLLQAEHDQLIKALAERADEHKKIEAATLLRREEAERTRARDLERQIQESHARIELKRKDDEIAINDHPTLEEARRAVIALRQGLAKHEQEIMTEREAITAAIDNRYKERYEELSKDPAAKGMFETDAQFRERHWEQLKQLNDLKQRWKEEIATNLNYYQEKLAANKKAFQDKINDITSREFPAERMQAIWSSYDTEQQALYVSGGPFLYRFDMQSDQAADLYRRKDKLKLESAYKYYDENASPPRTRIFLFDPLGNRFPESNGTVAGYENYWTDNRFNDFEVAASKTLDSGLLLTFILQHHHALHDVHPVRVTVSRERIAFDVLPSGLSAATTETSDTPPSSCNLNGLSTDIRNVASATVTHDKEEVFLVLKLKGGIEGVRTLTFADQSGRKQQSVSKGVLGIGVVRRSVHSRPEAERALIAVQRTIERASEQAQMCPPNTCASSASAAKTDALPHAEETRREQYSAQLIGIGQINPVIVQPIYKEDRNFLFIYWPKTQSNQVVKLDQIVKAKVEHRSIHLNPNANTIIEFKLGGPKEPKLYELILEVRHEQGKNFVYRFISDTAVCNASDSTVPCREGSDDAQQLRELATAIQKAVANRLNNSK